jgi:hypothetical protein
VQELAFRLQQLSFQELQQLCEEGQSSVEGQAAFSASFLFWLSGQEKQALGSRKQASRLTYSSWCGVLYCHICCSCALNTEV